MKTKGSEKIISQIATVHSPVNALNVGAALRLALASGRRRQDHQIMGRTAGGRPMNARKTVYLIDESEIRALCVCAPSCGLACQQCTSR